MDTSVSFYNYLYQTSYPLSVALFAYIINRDLSSVIYTLSEERMNKLNSFDELQKERSILDSMIEQAIKDGIRISKDEAILKQSQKVNKLVSKYHKEHPGSRQ